MKNKVDKLYIGKLETTPVDLSKLSNAVKNDVIKKTEYDELVKKVNVKKICYNAKIKDIEVKIPSVTNLVRATALTSVENKTPRVSNLVKKADYDAKVSEMEKNILLLSIIISSRVIHLIQR